MVTTHVLSEFGHAGPPDLCNKFVAHILLVIDKAHVLFRCICHSTRLDCVSSICTVGTLYELQYNSSRRPSTSGLRDVCLSLQFSVASNMHRT